MAAMSLYQCQRNFVFSFIVCVVDAYVLTMVSRFGLKAVEAASDSCFKIESQIPNKNQSI